MFDDVNSLYAILRHLQQVNQRLFTVSEWREIKLSWMTHKPQAFKMVTKGIYFFFDLNERRADGNTYRVVRIGTHGVKRGEGKTKLWDRMRNHRGTVNGQQPNGGNHRGSVFRELVGRALINRDNRDGFPHWNNNTAIRDVLAREHLLELEVSRYIRALPFVVLAINPNGGGDEMRKRFEANAIALLSNIRRRNVAPPCPDEPSADWLGHFATSDVGQSGLWQSEHIDDVYDRDFLTELDALVQQMESRI